MTPLRAPLCLLLLAAVARALWLSPYYPYNPHTQRHRQFGPHALQSPRDDYRLRQLFQDAETRCTLRLWRISRKGELDCEEDDDCTEKFGDGVYCRELQVCKLTKGNVCWLKQPNGGECKGNSACVSDYCDTELELCVQRQTGYHTTTSRVTS